MATSPYNIDETLTEGDPLHIEHHVALADAVNDLDDRVTAREVAAPTYVLSADVSNLGVVGWSRQIILTRNDPVPSGLPPYTVIVRLP